jgi:transketolase
MSVEAAATIGWSAYVGTRGYAFGIDHFGASAPAAAIAQAFGFTPDNLAQIALERFALAKR